MPCWEIRIWNRESMVRQSQTCGRPRNSVRAVARVQYLLALAHSYLGQVSESQACLRRALELDPAFCLAYYQLAKGELDRDNEPLAFEFLKKATACDPTQAPPHYQLSRIYSRRGESAVAEQEMRLFLKYRLPSTKGMVSGTHP